MVQPKNIDTKFLKMLYAPLLALVGEYRETWWPFGLQALLEIGRYRMEVEGDEERAREAFEQVSRDHAQSDAAPGAYHYLGLLTLENATTPAQLDDAARRARAGLRGHLPGVRDL